MHSFLERHLPDRVCRHFGERQSQFLDTYEAWLGRTTKEVCVWGLQVDQGDVVATFRALSSVGWGWPMGLAGLGTNPNYDQWWARRLPLRFTDLGGDPAVG